VRRLAILASCATLVFFFLAAARPAEGQSGLQRVNHIIVVMQENHSFDNYFGALAYAPGSPYHRASSFDRDGDRDPLDLDQDGCREGDHRCVVANDDRPAPSPGAIQVIIRERFLALPRSVSN
jgi:phospholipase C